MSKPNSVQWFLDKLIEHRIIIVDQTTYGDKVKPKHEILLEQAKAMHKEEQIDSLIDGMYKGQEIYFSEHKIKLDDNSSVFCAAIAEQYYNETFGE